MGHRSGAQEWRDPLFLSYGIDPPKLPDNCDGCGAAFSICRSLKCKKVGLITARHNELRDGVADLASEAFTPTHARGDPKMFTGRAVRGEKDKAKVEGEPPKYEGNMKGDILIRDLKIQGTDSIPDMRIVNNDTISHGSPNP